jgi:hypothetical protein
MRSAGCGSAVQDTLAGGEECGVGFAVTRHVLAKRGIE